MSLPSNQRFAALDSMRGIAAFLVVLQHSMEFFPNVTPATSEIQKQFFFALGTFDLGRIGVVCFFLISGFIIPSSFNQSSDHPLKEFALKRFFRLYPAYWASLALAILVDIHFFQHPYQISTIIANLTMLQNVIGEQHIQGLYWTLQVELIFYILCAAIFSIKKDRNAKFICITIFALLAIFAASNFAGAKFHLITKQNKELFYTPYLLCIMLCGTLFRISNQEESKIPKYVLLGFAATFSIPILAWIASLIGFRTIEDPSRFATSHIIGLLFFVGSLKYWKMPRQWSQRVGIVSYSAYLFHPIVMHLVSKFEMLSPWPLAPVGYFQNIILTTALTYIFAEAIFRLIESPSNNFAKSITVPATKSTPAK